MSDAVATIVGLERRVMWRKRLLSLRDYLVLAAALGALTAAALMLLVRLRPIEASSWVVVSVAIGLSFAAALTRWFLTRTRLTDAAFLIDESLNLDDRLATSHSIIEQCGRRRAIEEALIEDTAARVRTHRASSIAPSRTPRWYSLALISIAGLAVVLMIPQRSLPISEALAAERADIENAGEHLEQTAAEVARTVPAGTETATLAEEQAEVGRGFRRSTATRVEALRRLSALEERIRGRHDELASTRADQIVSLADRRLRDTLPTPTTMRPKRIEADASQRDVDELGEATRRNPYKSAQPVGKTGGNKSPGPLQKPDRASGTPNSQTQTPRKAAEKIDVADSKGKETKSAPQDRPQEPVLSDGGQKTNSAKNESIKRDPATATVAVDQPGPSTDRGQRPAEAKGAEKQGDQGASEKQADNQQPGEPAATPLDPLKAVPKSVAEQAAKSLPRISEELLKKAADLRANELSAADIEKLRKAAESLSRDLAQISQSKDLQRALQEMARQVRPEQIEQVARELGNQEKLKQELEASARLLSQNQQAKEMVAGLAGQFARMQDETRQKDKSQGDGGQTDSRNDERGMRNQASRSYRRSGSGTPENLETSAERPLAGQGREAGLKGKLQAGSQGEYLYLQSKAGAGAARAHYSSAYPQYRREAERYVQRSQTPPGLRSVVRKYFDAINPDSKR